MKKSPNGIHDVGEWDVMDLKRYHPLPDDTDVRPPHDEPDDDWMVGLMILVVFAVNALFWGLAGVFAVKILEWMQ